jgi:hypothetical protein
MYPALTTNDEVRFWRKTMPVPSGCTIWTGKVSASGYGHFWAQGRHLIAHRVAYLLTFGAIEPGAVLDHLCRVRACINPRHLEPVTQKENILRGEGLAAHNARKTHCPAGHEYTPDNTYHFKRSETRVGRNCRACERARHAASRPHAPNFHRT